MSKNTQIGELINYISVNESGNVVLSNGHLVATQNYVSTAVANLVDAAPATLDTLNELAAALGDDPNFATTVTNSIGGKLSLTGGTLSGALNGTSAVFSSTITASSTGGSGLRIYGAAGTNQWDIYLNSTNLRFSDNTGTGSFVVDRPATFSSSVTADSLLVQRTASRNMLGISSIALPTSGAEEGVAVVKTNSNLWQMSLVGYAVDSKGMRVYNTGGAGYTSFEVAQGAGTRFIVDGVGNVGIGVTPSAWNNSTFPNVLQVGFASLITNGGAFSQLSSNIFFDGSTYRHITTGGIGRIGFDVDGAIFFGNAASQAGGAAATFVERMRITVGGYLKLPQSRILGDSDICYIDLYNPSTGNLSIVNTSASTLYGNIILSTNNSQRMRITLDGTIAFNGNSTPNAGGLDKLSLGFADGAYGWIQTWGGRPFSINSQGNNVLIGKTSDNGNRLQVNGGTQASSFITDSGTTLISTFSVGYTTFYTVSNYQNAIYLVTLQLNGYSNYTAYATICQNDSGLIIMNQVNNVAYIQVSGLNIQGSQNSGVAQNMVWKIIKIN